MVVTLVGWNKRSVSGEGFSGLISSPPETLCLFGPTTNNISDKGNPATYPARLLPLS